MDTAKIRELIAELEQDVRVKTDAIAGLEKLLATTNGHRTVEVEGRMALRESVRNIPRDTNDSYVDLAVKIINGNDNRPMPIIQIVERIRTLKGNPNIERRSVEATLYQHTKNKGDKSRIVKVSPGVYGVRRFPREESAA